MMKIFFLLFFFAVSFNISAQTYIKPTFGLNIHRVEDLNQNDFFIPKEKFNNKSYVLGLSIEQFFNPHFSLELKGTWSSTTSVKAGVFTFVTIEGIVFRQKKLGTLLKYHLYNVGIGVGVNYNSLYEIEEVIDVNKARYTFLKDRTNTELLAECSYTFKNIQLAVSYNYGLAFHEEVDIKYKQFKPIQTINVTLGYRFKVLNSIKWRREKKANCPTF